MAHSGYLEGVFVKAKRDKIIELAVKQLKDVDFDTIAVRGVSGTTIGSILAHVMNKELAVVRKTTTDSHADVLVESPKIVSKYVFVDDFVDSGETLCYAWAALKGTFPSAQCVFIYEYDKEEKQRFTSDVLVNDRLIKFAKQRRNLETSILKEVTDLMFLERPILSIYEGKEELPSYHKKVLFDTETSSLNPICPTEYYAQLWA